MPDAYDHQKKAGNEGDICKHPALIAALEETLAHAARRPFKYADIFAGYAKSPLKEGGEWAQGVGVVAGGHLSRGNSQIAFWAECAGLNARPTVGGTYPGSAWFASEICKRRGRPAELWLWETSLAPFENLKATFSNDHVYNRTARLHELAIQQADFVFIDPPSKEHWGRVSELVRDIDPARGVLVWLPIGADTTKTPPDEDSVSRRCRDEALQLGMDVSTIRWAKGGHTIGCQLLYRLNPDARRAVAKAVEEIIHVAHAHRGDSPKWGNSPVHYNHQRI